MPSDWRVPGFTSTASLRPDALFGAGEPGTDGPPPERIARVATGRDLALGCGYHGWLDWCQGGGIEGVPAATRALYAELPFNDAERTRQQIREAGDALAVVVVEPVVVEEPRREWLAALREETARVGAVLVFDEIKTAFRLAVGGGGGGHRGAPRLGRLRQARGHGLPPPPRRGPQ